MSKKHPVTFKNVLELEFKQIRVGENTAITAIMSGFFICLDGTANSLLKL